ncbi:hypothetical protein NW762_008972 [Fusarium torreyae]|uniref:Uncharacterized protein n=1 Tax=Fusarium torreyae TaxID=1237075 RepID=A0A9W8VEY6_9HYPO|nr:hypothetical protein NW762_008972 [Fusarium torreyae]
MDIQTFVRGRDTPTLGIWGYLRSAQASTSTGLVDGVESVSGLPRSLIDIFARLGDASAEDAFAGWPGYEGILYPYTAARLEVSILQDKPSWVEALRKYGHLCDAYRETPNALVLEEILDNALQIGDNDIDLDKEAQQRGVELSLF